MEESNLRQVSRRTILTGAASAGILLTAAACAGSGGGRALKSGTDQVPEFVPARQVEGMHASKVANVQPAYTRYPPNPFKSVSKTPGDGSTVSTFQILFYPPPRAKSQNPIWQELDKRLGVSINPDPVTDDLYDQKMATLEASGKLPDLIFLNRGASPSAGRLINNGGILDLSPYLSGENIKDYPNLAALPTLAWSNSMVNGSIYIVPRPLDPVTAAVGLYRRDWAKELGVDNPKNADEVFTMMTAFAKKHPNGNKQTWALDQWSQGWFNEMFGAPNNWRKNPDGSLTKDLETDEFEQALDFMRRLWAAGAYHPDTATIDTEYEKSQSLFVGTEQVGMYGEGYISQFDVTGDRGLLLKTNPHSDAEPFVPPGHDGGKGQRYASPGYYGGMGIPASLAKNKSRVEMLLRVLDYYAAPFGSEEYLFMNYGLSGRDYNFDSNGNPKTTDMWSEVLALTYMCQPMDDTLYFPSEVNDALIAQRGIEEAEPLLTDPTAQLYSATALSTAGTLQQLNTDFLSDIVTGRKPLSAIKQWRSQWKSQGGDKTRQEFERGLKSLSAK